MATAASTRRVVAVTGGGTGVGAAVVRRLVAAGFDAAVFYKSSRGSADAVGAEAMAAGARILVQQMDVASDVSVRAGIAAALAHFGRLDTVINSAAITQLIPFTDLEGVGGERVDGDAVVRMGRPILNARATILPARPPMMCGSPS